MVFPIGYSLSRRVERRAIDVKYDYWPHQAVVFGRPTGGCTPLVGYTQEGFGGGAIELITTRYPTRDVSSSRIPAVWRVFYPYLLYRSIVSTQWPLQALDLIYLLRPIHPTGRIHRGGYLLRSTSLPYRIKNRWLPHGRNTVQRAPIAWLRGQFVRRQVLIQSIGFAASWPMAD